MTNAEEDFDLIPGTSLQLHVFIERRDEKLFGLYTSIPRVDLECPCPRTGKTALMTACTYRWEYAVSFLLNSGTVWVNAIDHAGRTALHHSEHVSIVKLLISAGIDVNYRSFDGSTALHNAARTGNHSVR